MLRDKERVAIWLFDAYARAFLGAQESETPSRWVAVGTVLEADPSHGIWLTTERVEERRPGPDGKRVAWTFNHPTALLRWDGIITVQVVEGDDRTIGFRPSQ